MAEIEQKYRDIADRMIVAESKLKGFQRSYERMSRLEYELPASLKKWQWIHPIVSTAPYDAIRGTVRALSNLDEAVSVHPMSVLKEAKSAPDSEKAKEIANRWEDVLKYNLSQAAGRRKSLREDIVFSIGLYDIAAGYIMHVPTQMELIGANSARTKAAAMFGDWALRMLDPKTVYVEWSDYMPERFLMVSVKKARQILEHWGDLASEVEEKARQGQAGQEEERLNADWVEYEMVDHQFGRTVWASEGPTPDMERGGTVIMGSEPWMKDVNTGDQVPFLPFIAAAGGTSIDMAPEHRLKPILYPVLMTEQWATANISGTIMMSQQVASASSVTDVYKGPGADRIEEDFSGPRRRIDLTPYQEYQQLQDAGLDSGLREVFDRLEGSIQRATVAEVLVTARPLSGEQAFAAYNLQVQQALASLGGIRATGQMFLADVYSKMLLIAHYTGNNIVGIAGKKEYTINSEDIDPENIRIKVELKADVPADRVQRVSSASQLAQTMQYPMSRILPMLGETDPEGAMKEYYWEQMERTYFTARMEQLQMTLSGEMQQQVQMLAQQMVEQMMKEQGQQQGQPQQGPPQQGGGQQQGMVEPQTNAAAGEMPYAMVSPEGNTFEGKQGRTRGQQTPITTGF